MLEDCSQDRANGFLAMFASYPWPSLGKGAIRLSPRKRAYIKVILGNGHCCCSWERSGGDCCHYAPSMLLSGLDEGYTQDLDNGGSLGVLTICNGSLPAHLESGDTKVCVVLFSWSLGSGGSMMCPIRQKAFHLPLQDERFDHLQIGL